MDKNKKIAIIVAVVALIVIAIIVFLLMRNTKEIYTVSFDSDGGEIVSSQQVEAGKTAVKPDDPSKEGYEFLGWYIGKEKFDFSKPIKENVTLKAKWEKGETVATIYTITLDIDGKKSTLKTDESGMLAEPEKPTKEGYTFLGWYIGNKKVDFSKPFTSNSDVVAKWEKEEEKKEENTTNKSENNTSTTPSKPTTPTTPSKPTEPTTPTTPTEPEKPTEPETPVVTTYTVTFDSNGGSSVGKQTITSGKTATKPSNPTKSGYLFIGWYLGDNQFNFSTPINKNVTLTAKWEKEKVVSYKIEKVENSVVDQVRIFVTLDGEKVNGTVDIKSISGTVKTVNVPSTGYMINKNIIDEIMNVKVK